MLTVLILGRRMVVSAKMSTLGRGGVIEMGPKVSWRNALKRRSLFLNKSSSELSKSTSEPSHVNQVYIKAHSQMLVGAVEQWQKLVQCSHQP